MKTKSSKISQFWQVLFILVGFFSGTTNAVAEYCDMIGGAGEIKWIHIPRSQFQISNAKEIHYNEIVYKIDRSKRLFVKYGLPSVNDVVTLNDYIASTQLPDCLTHQTCSAFDQKRWEDIKLVDKKEPYIYQNGKASINTSAYQCSQTGGGRGCWDLNKDANLKILSYTYIDQILFALVYVVSC